MTATMIAAGPAPALPTAPPPARQHHHTLSLELSCPECGDHLHKANETIQRGMSGAGRASETVLECVAHGEWLVSIRLSQFGRSVSPPRGARRRGWF